MIEIIKTNLYTFSKIKGKIECTETSEGTTLQVSEQTLREIIEAIKESPIYERL